MLTISYHKKTQIYSRKGKHQLHCSQCQQLLTDYVYFQSKKGTDYLENNCAVNPVGMCQFKPVKGRILKTVDSVFQNVKTIEDCRQKCIESNYR